MRNTVYLLLLVLISCKTDPQFLIKGQLPDKTYDGETIYLVPLENAVKERVDSTVIADGMFRFEGKVNASEMFILRAKPVLRYNLQELLIVKEPGEVTVKIGKSSSVAGTALNDSLEQWKEKKAVADYLYEELRHQFKMANEADQPAIKQKADSLNNRIIDFHFNFVRRNRDNIVGNFVEKIMGNSFSPEQQKNLKLK
jgi:hypothetical protein